MCARQGASREARHASASELPDGHRHGREPRTVRDVEAGSLQNFDGNGPFLQASAGNGPVTVTGAQPGGGPGNELFVSHEAAAPIGTRPVLGSKPPFNTSVACQNNAVPDLNGPAAALGSPSPAQLP